MHGISARSAARAMEITGRRSSSRATSGFSLIEVSISIAILGTVLGGVLWVVHGARQVTTEHVLASETRRVVRDAMNRIVEAMSGAVTSDASLLTFAPNDDGGFRGVRFREVTDMNAAGSSIEFATRNTYIYGPDDTVGKNRGLVLGTAETLEDLEDEGGGSDGLLGTVDDTISLIVDLLGTSSEPPPSSESPTTRPVVDVLIHEKYQPRSGEMFAIEDDAGSDGRFRRFTIRANVRSPDGLFLLDQDVVLTQRVALRR